MEIILGKIKELAASAKVVKATELANELGTLVAQNVVMVGALAASELLPIPEPAFEQTIAEIFEDPKKRDFNLQAFRLGVRGYQESQSL
jgi:Pyruvate/2-oxoacid:ferredoxin oxidoreductase gamma subunit